MSEVISFRLDLDKPREARALKVLNRWREDGYNIRHIVVEAILLLDDPFIAEQKSSVLDEINEKLSLLSQVIGFIEVVNNPEGMIYHKIISDDVVTENFIQSVKKSVKPGLKI